MKNPLFRLDGNTPLLAGTECKSCRHRWFPAVSFGCERCGAFGTDLISREFSGEGRLLSQVTVNEGDNSFILAMIELTDGPVLGGIIEGQDSPAIGDPLEAFGTEINGTIEIRFRRRNG